MASRKIFRDYLHAKFSMFILFISNHTVSSLIWNKFARVFQKAVIARATNLLIRCFKRVLMSVPRVSGKGHSPALHCAPLQRLIYGVISTRSCTRPLKTLRICLDIEFCRLKNGYSSLTSSVTPFFSSHFNQLIISFA